jgi:hypothetical protein
MGILRPFALLALVVSLTSPTIAWSQARHDGNLWGALSRELKISYIQGVIDGSTLGAMLAKEGLLKSDPCQDQIIPSYRRTAEKLLAEVSPGQIADGVDTVFKDYRNRSLLMTDAVYVTLRAIAGMPPQDIEKLLQAVRSAPR